MEKQLEAVRIAGRVLSPSRAHLHPDDPPASPARMLNGVSTNPWHDAHAGDAQAGAGDHYTDEDGGRRDAAGAPRPAAIDDAWQHDPWRFPRRPKDTGNVVMKDQETVWRTGLVDPWSGTSSGVLGGGGTVDEDFDPFAS